MEKRAQVTMFVILGIVIVAVIGIALYFRGGGLGATSSSQISGRESLNQEARQFAESVDRCIENTLVDAIIEVSRNGGDYPAGKESIDYNGYRVPVYYDNGKELIYSKDRIRSGMEDYMSRNLIVCVNGIGKDYELSGAVNSRVTFGKETRAEVSMPVVFGTSKLVAFLGIIDFDYNKIYGDMSSFYGQVKVFNGTVDMVEMSALALSSRYRFSKDYLDGNVIYILGWDVPVLVSRLEFPFAVRMNESSVFAADTEPEYAEEKDEVVSDSDVPPEEPGAANVSANSEINIGAIENEERIGDIIAKL